MKKILRIRVFLAVLACATLAVAGQAGKTAGQARQKTLTYDETVTRTASLQSRADSLAAVLEQLRQDSTKAGQEQSRQNAGLSKKQAELEDALAKKHSQAASTKTQYDKAHTDSVAIVTKSKDQITAFHKELQQSESSLSALSNELALLISRQDRISASSSGADEKMIAKLQAMVTQRDSLLRERQADIEYLSPKLDKLRQDSSQAETRRNVENNRFHQQITRIDSMITVTDAAITQIERKMAGTQSEKNQKAALLQQSAALFTKQKQNTADQINRSNAALAALDGERERLTQSSGTARQKYEALRRPLETAFSNAGLALQQEAKDKRLLIALRKKCGIDSAVFKARDELDYAIQAEAEKKKGAKKLVEQRENELEAMLQRQDSITRSTPGLRVRESQFRASTNAQKSRFVDTAIAQSDTKIAAATAQLDKAKQNLALFEQTNPEPQNTSSARITQLDALIAVKKKEIIQLTGIGDSLNILLQEVQTSASALSTKGKNETGKVDSTLQNIKNDKIALSANRSKIQRDSAQADAAAAGLILHFKTDMAAVAGRIVASKNDIAMHSAERDKEKLAIIAAQEKNRQSSIALAAEKKKLDSSGAATQEEITLVSAKIEALRKDSAAAVRQQDQQIKAIAPSTASIAGLMTGLDRDILVLQMQRDSLAKAALAGSSRGDNTNKKFTLQISAVNRTIESTRNEIVTMNAMKEEAFNRLKDDKAHYDSMLVATERDIEAIIAKRDKAHQDSIQAEYNVRQSSGKVASIIRRHDSIIAVRQKELSDFTAEHDRLVNDSNNAAEKAIAPLQRFSQSIKAIDAQIAGKEKEIADLKAKKDKIKQDSIGESRNQAGLLAAAHAEIVKSNSVILQKKMDVSLAMAEKKKAQADTVSIQKKAVEAVTAATIEIKRQTDLLAGKQAEVARVQKERDAVAGRIRAVTEKNSGIAITDEPAPAKIISPADMAQKKAEEIYTLLGENKIAEASKKFKSLQLFFKTNLDAESFTALKTTIEQMGGTVK